LENLHRKKRADTGVRPYKSSNPESSVKLLIAGLVMVIVSIARAQSTQPAAGIVSPEVHADRTVTFRIYAPKATEVSLFADWVAVGTTRPMSSDGKGVWSITQGPLPPGIYIYTFTVDGVTMPDPVNPRVKLRWRTSASLVDVPGKGELWEPRDVPHGKVEINYQKSSVLGETRPVWIYTPPGYSGDSERRYPVLYLFHGFNDTAAGWTTVGGANFILDNLVAENRAAPMIVVMPYGHTVPYTAPRSEQAKNSELFERYVMEDLWPLVEHDYRIKEGRENHAVAGLSMGGGHALQIGLNHLDRFAAVGAFSSATPQSFEGRVRSDASELNEKLKVLWISCGRDDPAFGRWQRLDGVMNEQKVRHTFWATEGAHTFSVWRASLGEFVPLLFR
jgi:enterochelin esterase-like enzyme